MSTYFNKKQFDKSLKIHPIIEQLESGISIMPYSSLPYEKINPYINNFFSLTETVSNIIKTMEIKYNINYENTCCVFYRGLDKCVETELPSYDVILNKALKVTENEKNIKFILQTDETNFLNYCKNKMKDYIVFNDEIRHTAKANTLVEKKFNKEDNYFFSLHFLAIVKIMSKCKYVVCNSSNVSFMDCFI